MPSATRQRSNRIKRLYGRTLADYDATLAAQGGGCAVCGYHPRPGENLCCDHSHATGLNRGILCHPCNTALGLLKESPTRIRALLTYILSYHPLAE